MNTNEKLIVNDGTMKVDEELHRSLREIDVSYTNVSRYCIST